MQMPTINTVNGRITYPRVYPPACIRRCTRKTSKSTSLGQLKTTNTRARNEILAARFPAIVFGGLRAVSLFQEEDRLTFCSIMHFLAGTMPVTTNRRRRGRAYGIIAVALNFSLPFRRSLKCTRTTSFMKRIKHDASRSNYTARLKRLRPLMQLYGGMPK